jgi:hypothetical protein
MEQVPIEIVCPRCGARPFETCKSKDGLQIHSFHPERWPKKTSNEAKPSSMKLLSRNRVATQTVITAAANVLKEFWPDIRKNMLRIKDE